MESQRIAQKSPLREIQRPPQPPQSLYNQTILWTALPAGTVPVQVPGKRITETWLKIRVFVTPRLFGPTSATIQNFPDFLDWPLHCGLNAMGFQVNVYDRQGQHIVSTITPQRLNAPESLLWKSIVLPNTPVLSYQSDDNSNEVILSYPAGNISRFLSQAYAQLALDSPTKLPSVQRILDPQRGFGAIAMKPPGAAPRSPAEAAAQTRYEQAQQNLQQILGRYRVVPPGPPNPALDFLQLRAFHAPRNRQLPPKGRFTTPAFNLVDMRHALGEFQSNLDFHRLHSLLGSYPELMRRLGLVIELAVPVGSIPDGAPIQVIPQWKPALPTNSVSFLTSCKVFPNPPGPPIFLASSQDAQNSKQPMAFGMLVLATLGRQYNIVEFDADRVGQNMLSLLAGDLLSGFGSNPSASSAVPTLNSAGFSLSLTGRGLWLQQKQTNMQNTDNYVVQSQSQPGQPAPVLSADDLVRGYRVDVYDEQLQRWFSLCQRIGTYTLQHAVDPSLASFKFADEGFVQLGATKAADGSSPNNLFVTDWIFRWNGWSLAAPRPGQTIMPDGTVGAPDYANPNGTAYGIGVKFQPAPNSLPPLRFGRNYRIRVRVVDLSGYSRDLTDVDDAYATKAIPYFRYEPIDAPLLALARPLALPGETAEKLVIRSNYQQSVQAYSNLHPAYLPTSDRHIAPPVTTPLMAETHGKFDGMPPDASYAMISQHESMPAVDANSGNMMDSLMAIPYLPDPLARGPAFLLYPITADVGPSYLPLSPFATLLGPGASSTPIDFYPNGPGSWPSATPVRLQIVDGGPSTGNSLTAPVASWDSANRTVKVQVPQGQTLKVRMSSYLTSADLDGHIMGLWDMAVQQAGPQGLPLNLRPLALLGAVWMLTPTRELTLVHAVQQPLVIPNIQNMRAERQPGDTVARFTTSPSVQNPPPPSIKNSIPVDGNSTAKLEFLAQWNETVDPVAEDQPRVLQGQARAFEIRPNPGDNFVSFVEPLQRPQGPPNPALPQPRHEFHDTKHRMVTYTAVATSRYQDYFPQDQNLQFTEVSQPLTLDISSSARPAAPKVLYIIPCFDWQASGAGSAQTRKRITALRVYLDRPWYSSGDGELLGVVLFPNPACQSAQPPPLPPGCQSSGGGGLPLGKSGTQGGNKGQPQSTQTFSRTRPSVNQERAWVSSPVRDLSLPPQKVPRTVLSPRAGARDIPNSLMPYVTQWGMDPLWLSGPVSDVPGLSDFTNYVAWGPCLTLEELTVASSIQTYDDSLRVNVAGFQPAYDKNRKLWYCDIKIDPQGSYFPFIRLALARFQPHSLLGWYIDGCTWSSLDVGLSRVVLAEFAQIAPNRTLSVTEANATQLNVTVTGEGYTASGYFRSPSLVQVTLETHPVGGADDLGWVPVTEHPQQLTPKPSPPNMVWQGQINLPGPRGSQPLRLVIKEYELFDSGQAGGGIVPSSAGRLVYADTVRL